MAEQDLQSIKARFNIIGNSENYLRALRVAVQVAPTDLTVLISGESGVGKEVFSKIIHELSLRRHNSFIAVNCGAIPEGTIDSELFGHEKGAFTGAVDNRKGYFEVVNGGTIFLDEIGEMPPSTQARLLRVLETGEYIRVGSSKTQKTDVRVVAATNVNLLEAIAKGRFREDLYYRLNTVPITVPPLRERREDIPLLFRKFTVDFAERNRMQPLRLNEDAKNRLINYRFPGNVRELKNIAEQMTVLSKTRDITEEEILQFLPTHHFSQLPALAVAGAQETTYSERELMYKLLFDMRKDINELKQFMFTLAERGYVPSDMVQAHFVERGEAYSNEQVMPYSGADSFNTPIILSAAQESGTRLRNNTAYTETASAEIVDESLSLMDKEQEMIIKALKKYNGKRKLAAEELGISERTLYRKIKEYKIDE
ncbi:MAG: sigma-54-dependent Fis family transcriptional regulator [Sphingobacteriales bacterium]|nr:sigma-54-dependent Fis family transcriptional regulator [Sphingobacteriales bacterium]